jgi:hypothetical protein
LRAVAAVHPTILEKKTPCSSRTGLPGPRLRLRVRRSRSAAPGNSAFVPCQYPQTSFLLPRVRPGWRSDWSSRVVPPSVLPPKPPILSSKSALSVDSNAVLEEAATFFQEQFDRDPGARRYVKQHGLCPAGACAVNSPLKVILSISFDVSACSTPRAATPSTGRLVFPCWQGGRIVNLYGRGPGDAFAHRFPKPRIQASPYIC